eukprot:7033767-Pyramimonas_sp.AAC.1
MACFFRLRERPLEFVWGNAHQDIEEILTAPSEVLPARFPWKLPGRLFHAFGGHGASRVAQVAVDAVSAHLKAAKRTWSFLSRAVQVTLVDAARVDREHPSSCGPAQRPPHGGDAT